MKRVYLLADFGKGPKMVTRVRAGSWRVNHLARWASEGNAEARRHWRNWKGDALAWWLVEAESAALARGCIALWKAEGGVRAEFNDIGLGGDFDYLAKGRILASGGVK